MDPKDYQRCLSESCPVAGYNFCVFLDGQKIGFQSVSGLVLQKNVYEPFHESGDNFYIGIHRRSKKELNRLTLTKGMGLFNPSKLMSRIDVMLMLVYDSAGKPVHGYAFSTGYVESVTVSDFNAAENKAVIDTTVILYDHASEVDLTGASTKQAYERRRAALAEAENERKKLIGTNASRIAAHNAAVRAEKLRRKEQLEKNKKRKRIEY